MLVALSIFFFKYIQFAFHYECCRFTFCISLIFAMKTNSSLIVSSQFHLPLLMQYHNALVFGLFTIQGKDLFKLMSSLLLLMLGNISLAFRFYKTFSLQKPNFRHKVSWKFSFENTVELNGLSLLYAELTLQLGLSPYDSSTLKTVSPFAFLIFAENLGNPEAGMLSFSCLLSNASQQ